MAKRKSHKGMVLTDQGEYVKKITPHTPYWESLANHEAREYIDIVPCSYCGYPRGKSFTCDRCGYE